MTNVGEPPKTLIDAIGQVITKGWYGHQVGRVLTISLAVERIVDLTLVEAVAREDPWSREFVLENVWHRVSQDQKPGLIRQLLIHRGIRPEVADRSVAAIKELWRIRNVIAHSALTESPIDEAMGLNFEGYRFGKQKEHKLGQAEIDKALEAADAAARLVADVRSRPDFASE